jgi:hypothetical protein
MYKVLFYDDGDPFDYRAIKRFLFAFSPDYTATVQTIIPNSERMSEGAFRFNIARLMPTFGMTRQGAFQGLKLQKNGVISDPRHVIDSCWRAVGEDIRSIKAIMEQNSKAQRSRIIAELSQGSRDYVIKETSRLFDVLSKIQVKDSFIGRVGASKVLFSVLPEVALPVDNAEWDDLFETDSYGQILRTMSTEIKEWEQKTGRNLEKSDAHKFTTLPSIYNVMAMSARPLD